MGDKIIRTPVKGEKSFINRELDPPLTELQTVCNVGWTHGCHEQLVMEYEAILRGERSLMPKSGGNRARSFDSKYPHKCSIIFESGD
ncbi:hypothetical protein TNCV_4497811 [Trichonephila clavipes]|nr:hypothetical protein TNCV_4497811 [Trichonephila clavipes]